MWNNYVNDMLFIFYFVSFLLYLCDFDGLAGNFVVAEYTII